MRNVCARPGPCILAEPILAARGTRQCVVSNGCPPRLWLNSERPLRRATSAMRLCQDTRMRIAWVRCRVVGAWADDFGLAQLWWVMINKDYFYWNPFDVNEQDWLSQHLEVGTDTPSWAQVPNPLFDPCTRDGRCELHPHSTSTLGSNLLLAFWTT